MGVHIRKSDVIRSDFASVIENLAAFVDLYSSINEILGERFSLSCG